MVARRLEGVRLVEPLGSVAVQPVAVRAVRPVRPVRPVRAV